MPRHRVLTPLRWSDMDAYGHVNNVQFLRLIEDARVVAFAATGSDQGGSLVDTGLLVARSEIDLWVTDVAGASFEMGYEVLDEGGGDEPAVVYARAETTMVIYDMVKHRPRRLAPEERQRLDAWLDGPVPWRHRRTVRR
jgi:acyl-CoA thioester hydrolase